ncbi:MAG: hypothetical protein EOP62_15195 [Sphingomonadales bacterium]|nr:MAG: hypothetical protein EOP62_15195 [Sphingomonadales bacterium]
MEVPSHSISIDLARNLVDVRLVGLVTPEHAVWIGEEVREAVRSLGDGVGEHLTLYDASAVLVVPTATIALMQQAWVNPEVRALWARKVAYVASTALCKLQANRLREGMAHIEVFDNRDAALEWLLA